MRHLERSIGSHAHAWERVKKVNKRITILQSLDAGKDEVLFSIDIARDGKGFIVGRSGLIRITQDGGKTWVRNDSQNKSHFFDVVVLEGGNAWVVGQLGTILHTKDGGAT